MLDAIWWRNYYYTALKFKYSEKATNFFEISTLLLTAVHTIKSKVEISQNFVAFSEYINFNIRAKSYYSLLKIKVHMFLEGHKILWNLHLTFVCMYFRQK